MLPPTVGACGRATGGTDEAGRRSAPTGSAWGLGRAAAATEVVEAAAVGRDAPLAAGARAGDGCRRGSESCATALAAGETGAAGLLDVRRPDCAVATPARCSTRRTWAAFQRRN